MRAQCAICQEIFMETDVVVAPQCGHTFHSHCVYQWLEGSSKSCPQCRIKTNTTKLLRIYFNVTYESTGSVDPALLQQKIDTMTLSLAETEKEKAEVVKENVMLKKKVNKIQKEIQERDKLVSDQRTQLSFLNKQQRDFEAARKQAQDYQEKLKTFEGLQKLLTATEKEVQDELEASGDGSETARRLITYCTVLKRELMSASTAKGLLQEQLRKTRRDLGAARAELQQHQTAAKDKEECLRILEEDIQRLQSENSKLVNKVKSLQEAVVSPSGNVKNSIINRLIQESPAPASFKKPRLTDPENDDLIVTPKITSKKLLRDVDMNDTFDVKYRKFRTAVFGSSSDECQYDGLGGHSKLDVFPQPKTEKMKPKTKPSRPVLKTTSFKINGKVQKATIENFFTSL